MPDQQQMLPTFDWPGLIPGPVFLCFELQGKPGHKGRHRSRLFIPKSAWTYPQNVRAPRFMTEAGVRQIFIQQYPDPDTEAYEKTLRQYAGLLMNRKRVPPTEKPLALLVHSYREIPKSWSQRDHAKALAGYIRPVSRPDGDNYLKAVQDALNEVVWCDDSQVVDARIIKMYSDRPALRIEVRELVEPGAAPVTNGEIIPETG